MAKYHSLNFETSPENLGHSNLLSFFESVIAVDNFEKVSFNNCYICAWKASLLRDALGTDNLIVAVDEGCAKTGDVKLKPVE